MRLNIFLSVIFAVVTSFAAIHEVKHITHDDSSTCLVCTVNNNLVSADAVTLGCDVEIFRFEKILQNNPVSYTYKRIDQNRNRAPPKIS